MMEQVVQECMACGQKDLREGLLSKVLLANNPYFNMAVPLQLCRVRKNLSTSTVSIMIQKRVEEGMK